MPVLAPGQDASTLSCSGGFSYPKNAGENFSYDYVGLSGAVHHDECCCKAYPWPGWIRHIDPKYNKMADQEMIAHNNAYSREWCNDMIFKHKGLGKNAGYFKCSKRCENY